jgi:hypothetical protein
VRRAARWSTSALLLSAATMRQMDRLAQQIDSSKAGKASNVSRVRALVIALAVIAAFIVFGGGLVASGSASVVLHAAPHEPINLCMFTNREAPALAVINTVFQNAAHPEAVIFHIVVSEVSCCQAIIALSGRYAVLGKKLLVHTLGELTRVLLNDGFAPPWTLPPLPDGDKDAWLVRPAGWDLDGKHNSPLNHLRFYSARPATPQRTRAARTAARAPRLYPQPPRSYNTPPAPALRATPPRPRSPALPVPEGR